MHDGGIAGEIQRKGGLTDRRTGSQDDEVGLLPPHRHPVDRLEAGRNAAQAGLPLHLLDLGHRFIDDAADILDILLDVVLDGVEHLGLGAVDEVVDVGRLVVGHLEDIRRSLDEVALDRLLLEHLDVVLDIGGRTDLAGEVRDGDGPAHRIEGPLGAQFRGDRHHVDGGVFVDERLDGLEDHLILRRVDARYAELLHRSVDRGGFDQHRTEDSLFNFKSLRRFVSHLKPYGFQIDCLIFPGFFPGFWHKRKLN